MTAVTASLSHDQATCAPVRRTYARSPGAGEAKQVDEITATSDVAHGDDALSSKAAETAAAAFAAKAKDLEALRTAVVDAASVGAGLWFSYLFVLLYLAIAVGSVTHRDLLFENPVKWDAEKGRYELKEVGPGAFARAVKPDVQGSDPMHYICPTCYEQGKKTPLQALSQMEQRRAGDIRTCFTCKTAVAFSRNPNWTNRTQ
jgi:hypothetical protein